MGVVEARGMGGEVMGRGGGIWAGCGVEDARGVRMSWCEMGGGRIEGFVEAWVNNRLMSSVLFREFVVFECAADVARDIRAAEIVHGKGKVGTGCGFAC